MLHKGMNLGDRKICPKGYKKNKNKTASNPYDCTLKKPRCPNGYHKTKKGCVENSTARNNRTKKRESPRQFVKYYSLKGTLHNLSSFAFDLRTFPFPRNPNYPGRIAEASITRLSGKIEDELAKGNSTIIIDRDDMVIIDNTMAGSMWIEKLEITPLERTNHPTPKKSSPLRKSPKVNRYSLRTTSKFYILTSTVPQFKVLVKKLSANPKTASLYGLVAKVSVKRLIRKLQASIKDNIPTVILDRDDMFTLDNTEEGKKWNTANSNNSIKGIERSPLQSSPPYDPSSPVYDPSSPPYDPSSYVYDPSSPPYDPN